MIRHKFSMITNLSALKSNREDHYWRNDIISLKLASRCGMLFLRDFNGTRTSVLFSKG